MARIKMNVGNLEHFLDLCKGEGTGLDDKTTQITDDLIIKVSEHGIKANSATGDKTVLTVIRYETEEVIEKGKIPVGSIEQLKNYLGRFNSSDSVEFGVNEEADRLELIREEPRKVAKINKNDLEDISSYREGISDMVDKKFEMDVDNNQFVLHGDEEDTIHDTKVIVDASMVEEVLKDGKVVSERSVPFKIEEKGMKIEIGNPELGGFETIIPAEINGEKDYTAKYGSGLENIYPHLDGEVVIYIMQDGPAWVHKQAEDYRADYIKAPVTQ